MGEERRWNLLYTEAGSEQMARFIDRPNLHPRGFNYDLSLPYGLRVAEVRTAIEDLYDFLHNVNRFLTEKGWDRLEETLMAATFSGMISELVVQSMSKQSASLIRNQYHNGRPDLLPSIQTTQCFGLTKASK